MSQASREHLVELKRVPGGGVAPVVVFVHSSSGSANGFRRLAGHLRAPARYVAFEALEPGADDSCSVTAIAGGYWSELQAVLREEPSAELVLVGWSFGGAVAVEIAFLAETAGRGVASVILLDAATPDLLKRRDGQRCVTAEIASMFGVTDVLPTDQAGFDDEELAVVVFDRLTQENAASDLSASDLLPYIKACRWHLKAVDATWCSRPCRARVTQIRAADEAGWADAPADLGWSRTLHQDVRVLSTPGTHRSLLSAEHAPSLGPLIDAAVRQAAGWAGEDGLPLSSAQSRLWFLWQLEPDGAHYTTQFGWRIPKTTAAEVRHAWRRLCAHHTVLRSSYRLAPTGEPRRFADPAERAPVEMVRVAASAGGTSQALADLAAEHFRRPFDLRHGSVRAVVADEGSGAVWLLVTCHHIAVDGWCLEVIERDLRQLLRCPDTELPEPAADYQDFVAWEQRLRASPSFDSQLAYWADALKDIEVSPPPPDMFEDAQPGAASLRFQLPAETVGAMEASVSAAGMTLFAGVLTCVAVALQEWAGSLGVAIGVNLVNRPTSDLEGVVGMFVDPVTLWLKLPLQGRFLEAADHVWDRLTAAYEYADVPYQDVVSATVPAGRDRWNPLFWVIVNMEHLPGQNQEHAWAPVPSVVPPDAKFPFAVLLQHNSQGLNVEFLYPRDRYRPSTVDRVRRRFEQLVRSAGANGFDSDLPPVDREIPLSDRFSKRFGALLRNSTAP